MTTGNEPQVFRHRFQATAGMATQSDELTLTPTQGVMRRSRNRDLPRSHRSAGFRKKRQLRDTAAAGHVPFPSALVDSIFIKQAVIRYTGLLKSTTPKSRSYPYPITVRRASSRDYGAGLFSTGSFPRIGSEKGGVGTCNQTPLKSSMDCIVVGESPSAPPAAEGGRAHGGPVGE